MKSTKTLKLRLKDKHAGVLSSMARELNCVWNYCNAAIFVGNVQASAMVKTKMAKSTLDAGWSMLRMMLEYKSHQTGIVFEEVNEAYTTQTCSRCGAQHQRDVNAARNIAARGYVRPAGGIPVL